LPICCCCAEPVVGGGGSHCHGGEDDAATDEHHRLLDPGAVGDSAADSANDSADGGSADGSSDTDDAETTPKYRLMQADKRRRARTRWFLAITLANNTVLIAYRKHRLVKTNKQSFAGRWTGQLRAGVGAATHAAARGVKSLHLSKKLSNVKSANGIVRSSDGRESSGAVPLLAVESEQNTIN
jgi:hypothetical protein